MESDNFTIYGLSVYELNQKEVTRLAPLLFYMSLIGLFGIPGNAFVIYVFRNSCRNSNSHLFFVWLAIIDLFNCSLILPFEFVNVVNQYTYDYDWLCKMTIFFTIWPTVTSGLTLAIISIDRFRKVCRSLKWQFSNRTARILCLIVFIIGLLFSWPAFIIFGIHEFEISPQNLTGKDCAITNEYESTLYVRLYNGFLWILFVSTISIIILLYIIIGRQIFEQTSKIKSLTRSQSELLRNQANRFNQDCVADEITSSSGQSSSTAGFPFGGASSSGSMSLGQKNDGIHRSLDFTASVALDRQFSKIYEESTDRKIARSQARARKSAMIMFLISLAFIISYLPYLILRLLEGITLHFVISMSDTDRALYKTFLRSYWLNCAINPFIYCACAPQFRNECKAVWKKIMSWN